MNMQYLYSVLFWICISQKHCLHLLIVPRSNSLIRGRWRWCASCQNAVTIWWMWAGCKVLRWDTDYLLYRPQRRKHPSSVTSGVWQRLWETHTLFQGKITAQGKLLQQDTFCVSEQETGSRAKERRVFLFEQLVIFSEPIDKKKGFSLPAYTFKNSIKVSATVFWCIF